jgi:hypothetical protein
MFGKDYIEKLKTEKYPIDKYKIPTYREVMDKCIPKKSHVHATMRLARCSNSMTAIDECSNAIDLIIFPENEEKQFGMCIGSPSDNSPCKYRSNLQSGTVVVAKQSSEEKYGINNHAENTGFVSQEQFSKDPMVELEDRFSLLPALEFSKTGENIVDLHEAPQDVVEPIDNGCLQADGNSDGQTPMATVFLKPETNDNQMEVSDNLTSGKITDDIISMESNKYDTTNEQKENISMGITPGKVHNTTNTLETIDSEMLANISKGGLQIAHNPATPSPGPSTSSMQELQERSTVPTSSCRLAILSKSSKKTKRKQKEVEHFPKPEMSAELNSDTLLGPRKGPKGSN